MYRDEFTLTLMNSFGRFCDWAFVEVLVFFFLVESRSLRKGGKTIMIKMSSKSSVRRCSRVMCITFKNEELIFIIQQSLRHVFLDR